MTQPPFGTPQGNPMRRFSIFAAVFFVIVGVGSVPWKGAGGWHGFVSGFRAHAKHADQQAGKNLASSEGWTVRDCSGTDKDQTNWGWGKQERACEVRTITIARPEKLKVSSMNGGIRVIGEDRQDVRIEAKVQAWAGSAAEAADILHEIQIETAGGVIHDKGPNFHPGHKGYGISYVIHAPRQMSAELKTLNGGIELEHLNGELRFDTTNGGVNLSDLAGDVRGSTVNGGLDISLSGDRWNGKGLQAETTNGGIALNIPDRYSAHLETGTVNGGIEVNFPLTIQGDIKHRLTTDIGNGGPTIHAETTNGGVTLNHASPSAGEGDSSGNGGA
ncbi:MAG: hypothetical protein JOZ83_11225 [Silvibacterium sp.]|nr:hypothetical protein [Silvibacterium sp.]